MDAGLTDEQMEDYRLEYLEKLQKYRQVENDMKAFNDSLHSHFLKQQEEMSRLDLENYKLLEQLQIQET